jgi:hypothetical protein
MNSYNDHKYVVGSKLVLRSFTHPVLVFLRKGKGKLGGSQAKLILAVF